MLYNIINISIWIQGKYMKKFDKEYSTQYSPEKDYLLRNGIKPSFVKIIDNVTTYKYIKTAELFRLLSLFYK